LTLEPGVRLGSYQVVSSLGAGGMGEVYRATDTKLGRDVALKILPATFTNDPERLARFRREAQVLAALNHPHIGAIYGLDEAHGQQFLVLELIDGDTLADRIAKGPLSVDEALAIAKQIAEALEAAHEKGIVHRDLKPANIGLTQGGTVKVLDFGLAKAMDPISATSLDLSNSPTITSPAMMTSVGVILGTAAYMSPEQAKGRPADKRSDVWAFGCVLYEMLAGRRAFEGDDPTEVIAAIVRADPDWRAMPAGAPPGLGRLLGRCLRKERGERLDSFAAVRLDLEEARSPIALIGAPDHTRISLRTAAVAAAIALVVGSIAAAAILAGRANSTDPVFVAVPLPPDGVRPSGRGATPALSPDGKKLAFVVAERGVSRVWVRRLDSRVAQPLNGTENAQSPFWSPDSRTVAFMTDGAIGQIDASGGAVKRWKIPITASTGTNGTWGADGTILTIASGRIWRLSATTGEASAVVISDVSGMALTGPQFLPDGHHFLFATQRPPAARAGSLDAQTSTVVLNDIASRAIYGSGHLLYVRQGTLMAQPFDTAKLTVSGVPTPIVDRIATREGLALLASASSTGTIGYVLDDGSATSQIAWLDRSGKVIKLLGRPNVRNIWLAPDDSQAVFDVRDASNTSTVWRLDLAHETASRLTFDSRMNSDPVFSRDSRDVFFDKSPDWGLYRKRADGSGGEELILSTPSEARPRDISPDGRLLIYDLYQRETGDGDIWAFPLSGGGKPFQVVGGSGLQTNGRISPNGRWLAYRSDELGHAEIFVTSFPAAKDKWQVSSAGGDEPRWRSDGRELLFLGPNGKIMSVPVNDGAQFSWGNPAALFDIPMGFTGGITARYAVSRDGQRLLMNVPDPVAQRAPIELIINWPALLKK
jgi:serine/threonine protein kinase/dipeptidyl aminopeptidase/acylaminoacyl peptidase